jgi:hypothetical protein
VLDSNYVNQQLYYITGERMKRHILSILTLIAGFSAAQATHKP